MKTRYYRYTLQGEHGAADALGALGDAVAQGLVVRVDIGGGLTHVYIAGSAAAKPKPAAAVRSKAARSLKVKQVSERDVLKVR